MPKRDNEAPNRANDRNDKDAPKCETSNTDRLAAKRLILRKDIEDPI